MEQQAIHRCQQCDNLVTRLFPIHQHGGRYLSVCAGCYGLGLAQQNSSKVIDKRQT